MGDRNFRFQKQEPHKFKIRKPVTYYEIKWLISLQHQDLKSAWTDTDKKASGRRIHMKLHVVCEVFLKNRNSKSIITRLMQLDLSNPVVCSAQTEKLWHLSLFGWNPLESTFLECWASEFWVLSTCLLIVKCIGFLTHVFWIGKKLGKLVCNWMPIKWQSKGMNL